MKKIGKDAVAKILGSQVRRLKRKNVIKTIAVTGSIGKTSTKFAIAQVLSQKYKVQFQRGNYNDIVSVPLAYFGHELPNIYNPLAWLAIFWKNERLLKKPYPYEIVVIELGSDAPGQMEQFNKYVHAEIGVLTAITPEHMEFFADLDAVAKEEMVIATMCHKLYVNQDLLSEQYLKQLPSNKITYGIKTPSEIKMQNIKFDQESAGFEVVRGSTTLVRAEHEQVTEPQLYSICVASAIAAELGLSPEDIEKGIHTIKPVSGRMQQLKGANGSIIIDDTYNASPEATKNALDTLYRLKATKKIAILGNMNELGGYSETEHKKIGEYCDPKQLSLVVTIGPDANKYLAPAAEAKGCNVQSFDNPYKAGRSVLAQLEEGAVVLAKGSQNKVFAEEAVKLLLEDPADAAYLVRQSSGWLKKKQKAFGADQT